MRWTYACPSCGAMLNPDETVILLGVHGGRRALIGFHPEPGNYEIHVPPGTEVEPGARWEFLCPVCQGDLVTAENENLCALDLHEAGAHRRVLFSRVAGERATFVVEDRRVAGRYGEHAPRYVNYFVQMKYLL
jgi:hypothetical protein